MAKTIELLLTESVENLGIVGDVVKVRTGYARNYLLPRVLATEPSEELIQSLRAKRAEAEKALLQQRELKAATIEKLQGFELTMERACNDMGHLYAGVTQREIAQALTTAGYPVRERDVRMSGAIKRVDDYDIHIKYETDLETHIKLHVKSDRVLAKEEKSDMDFDNEGNLVRKRGGGRDRDRDRGGEGQPAPDAEAKDAKPEPEARKGKSHADGKDKKSDTTGGWGKKPDPAAITEEDKPQKAVKKPRADAKKDDRSKKS